MDPGSNPCWRDENGQRKYLLPRLDADNLSGDLGSGGRYEGDDTGYRENRMNLQQIAADVRHEAFQEFPPGPTAVPSAGNMDSDESRRAEQTAQKLDGSCRSNIWHINCDVRLINGNGLTTVGLRLLVGIWPM